MKPIHSRSRQCALVLLTGLTISCARAAQAQDRPLQSIVQGDLAPGVPQTYTVRAGAGDLILGTFELRDAAVTATVTVALYDEHGSKVKEEPFFGFDLRPVPLGFVTPQKGTYRIRITATSSAAGSYTLRTMRQAPAQRMAGVTVTPIVRFESPRMAQLAKDVSARQSRAVKRFWLEAAVRGGPLVETIDDNDQDVLATFL